MKFTDFSKNLFYFSFALILFSFPFLQISADEIEDDFQLNTTAIVDFLMEVGVINPSSFNNIKDVVCSSNESADYVQNYLPAKIAGINFIYFLSNEGIVDIEGSNSILEDLFEDSYSDYYLTLSDVENVNNIYQICVGRSATNQELIDWGVSAPVVSSRSRSGGGSSRRTTQVNTTVAEPVLNAQNPVAIPGSNLSIQDATDLINLMVALGMIEENRVVEIVALLNDNFNDGPSNEFSEDLELGAESTDVLSLQQFLNKNGFVVNSEVGLPGSIGFETNYFGELTRLALVKFQLANDIQPAVGYFGPKTRALINNLIK